MAASAALTAGDLEGHRNYVTHGDAAHLLAYFYDLRNALVAELERPLEWDTPRRDGPIEITTRHGKRPHDGLPRAF